MIGDLVPRPRTEQATQLIAHLARLIATVQGAALIVCLDQLEDVVHMDGAADRFRRIVNELVAFADAVPTGIVVLSCLDDYYLAMRDHLPAAKLDRIESNPAQLRLTASRSLPEIEAMVGRRLSHLYEDAGLTADAGSVY